MQRKRLAGFIVFGLFMWLLPSISTSATIDVDCGAGGIGIQAAINTASAGDTIVVTGTCNENIYIGETKEELTLDGGGTAIISAFNTNDHVVRAMGRTIKIQGFKSIGGGLDGIHTPGYPPPGGGAKIYIDNNTIENNSRIGINIGQNSYAVITNNTIQNNGMYGITVSEMSSARIGIVGIGDSNANPNIIQGNGIEGIRVTRSSYAIIVGNTIRDNTGNGISVSKVSHADIANNTIDNNGDCGINVTQNSGVNLGNDTGETIFDLPNVTTVKNLQWGIKATIGAYVDGRKGSLRGVRGVISVGTGSINHTIP
jgi:parallel beta-helix repeat protein